MGCQHPVPRLSRQPAALPGGFLPLVRLLARAWAKPRGWGGGGQVRVSPGCPATVVLLTGVPEQPPAPGWPQRAANCPGEEVRSDSPRPWVCPGGRGPPLPGENPGRQRFGGGGRGGRTSGMGAMRWATGTRTQNGVDVELRISTKQKKENKNPISLSKSRKKLGPWSSSL